MSHRYKLIDFQENAYLADLDYHRLLPVDDLVRDVFERLESDTEEIVSDLVDKYAEPEIRDCLHYLHWPQIQSFSKALEAPPLKIFAPRLRSTHRELRWNTLGASVAHIELLKALSKYATIHVTQEFEEMDNMVLTPFNIHEKSSAYRIIKENYDGVLLWYLDEYEMRSVLNYLHVPVVLPIYAARRDNGRITNGMMHWYASMRSFDAFMTLTQPTIDLYSTFIHDTSLFHVVPCGVDTQFFQPQDKIQGKQKIAELLDKPEITEKPVVGYISRFEVEKGAGVFMDVARLMPEVFFLAAGPIEESYHYDFPENFLHIGKRQEAAYAKAVLTASQHVNNNPRPFYFLWLKHDELPDVPIWYPEKEKGIAIASIVACAGDWFGGWTGYNLGDADRFITEDLQGGRLPPILEKELPCVLVGHWPGFYFNGEKFGFDILKTVKARLDNYDPDGTKTLWMKNSEIGHYYMARELTEITVLPVGAVSNRTEQIRLSTQFPTANFTLAFDTPIRHVQVNGWDLREVRSRRDFQRDTFLVEGKQTFVAFDLEVGETKLALTVA